MKGEFVELDVTRPHEGWRTMLDRYWIMRGDKALALKAGENLYPQCNAVKEVVEAVMRRVPDQYEGCHIRALSVAYFPKNPEPVEDPTKLPCSECGRPATGVLRDVGHGRTEAWGVVQYDTDLRYVSSCCHAAFGAAHHTK